MINDLSNLARAQSSPLKFNCFEQPNRKLLFNIGVYKKWLENMIEVGLRSHQILGKLPHLTRKKFNQNLPNNHDSS